jgi:hypothetical protein
MAQKTDKRRAHPGTALPQNATRGKGRHFARTIARGTLFVAGLAVSQFGFPENDPKFPIFSRTLVDRLHEPITRYHE